MWLAREALYILLLAQSETTGAHHLILGDTTGKSFCKNWQLLAQSPEYSLRVSLTPSRLEGRELLPEGSWEEINGGLGEAGEEVGSWVDRYGGPST